ncbi:MAG: RNA pseudouridine synthase [Paludibacteraceae bacterium]|nr:RNA pseudouridine synthase [Paludibacteraceae bacterium]
MTILYEDNHIIAVNKTCNEIVQGDKTGDTPLSETVKAYIKEKYNKPGEVFLGVTHRLDRPTSGVVLFARTSKALTRLNEMFKEKSKVESQMSKAITKTYWAIVQGAPKVPEARLENYLTRNEQLNKSFIAKPNAKEAKLAILTYKTLVKGENYTLLEINLETGRHHQIRCQLAAIGCPVKGDLKYGAKRSNPDGGISLHARQIEFIHPVKKEPICITAPVPNDSLWQQFAASVQ